MELQQIEELMQKSDQELLLEWRNEESKHTFGASADDLVGVVGNLRQSFLNWSEQIGLIEILCKRWGYPEKKKILLPAHLALSLCEYLAGMQGYHVPATTAVIVVLWAGDELCDGT